MTTGLEGIKVNDFFVPMDHPVHDAIEVMANPAKLSKTKEALKKPAPEFNKNTEEILYEIGFTHEEISQLKRKK